MRRAPFVPLALLLVLAPRAAGLGCLTAAGASSDWWFVSKAPGCTNASLPACSPLAFVDSSTPASLRGLSFAAGASAVGASALDTTLAQAARARATTARFFWNDDPPQAFGRLSTSAGKTNAHSKGALVADADGGFWLTHSWPEWPDVQSGAPAFIGVANASTIYGQSFLCVSLTVGGVEAVAAALARAEPLGYDVAVPAALAPHLPRLAALAAGGRNASATPTVLALQSAGGRGFTFFSKNGAWGRELWADLVGPALAPGGEMLVETWRRSPALASSCNSTRGNILNVNALALVVSGAAVAKSYTQDHSKYGITAAPPWVCVGDINRMASQAARGGGAVCFDHAPALWATINATFARADACNSTPLRAPQTVTPPASPVASPSPTASASTSPSPVASSSPQSSLSPSPTPALPAPAPAPTPAPTAAGLEGADGSAAAAAAASAASRNLSIALGSACAVAALACALGGAALLLRRRSARRALPTRTENPAAPKAARWRRVVDDGGNVFFEDAASGATAWALPPGAALGEEPAAEWRRVVGDDGAVFFALTVDGAVVATSWTLPAGARAGGSNV